MNYYEIFGFFVFSKRTPINFIAIITYIHVISIILSFTQLLRRKLRIASSIASYCSNKDSHLSRFILVVYIPLPPSRLLLNPSSNSQPSLLVPSFCNIFFAIFWIFTTYFQNEKELKQMDANCGM